MNGGKPKKMTPAEEGVVDTALRWADASSDALIGKTPAARGLAAQRAKDGLINLMAAVTALVRERKRDK